MAAIYERGGKWRAVIRRTGKPTRSESFRTQELAKAWARKVEHAMDLGAFGIKHSKASAVSIFERYSLEVSPHHKGVRWEQVRIKSLVRDAAWIDKQISKVVPEDIKHWRDERLTQVSAASVNRELNLIGAVFSHAIKEWGIGLVSNPVHLVKRPKQPRARDRIFTDEEIKRLCDDLGYPDLADSRGWTAHCFMLALETAMRLGEICAIQIEDLRLAERWLRLQDTKNGERRDVPLSKKAIGIIQTMVGQRSDGPLVPHPSGVIGLRFRQARDRLGIDATFHDSRHTATTRLASKFSNVLELSAITGHKELRMLKRYYNPKASDLASRLD